jgi:uncharacterized membrane protein
MVFSFFGFAMVWMNLSIFMDILYFMESVMKKTTTLPTLAAAGIMATAGLGATTAFAVPDNPGAWEKCAGVSKAGKNDCGAKDGSHACAGQAKADNLKTEWVYLPKGTCEKITGGAVVGEKPAKS